MLQGCILDEASFARRTWGEVDVRLSRNGEGHNPGTLNIFWGKIFPPRENWANFPSEGKFSLWGKIFPWKQLSLSLGMDCFPRKWRVWEKGGFLPRGKIYDFPPRGKIYLRPFFLSQKMLGVVRVARLQNSAHRNRSDFGDLRLRCPSQTPEISAISETRESNSGVVRVRFCVRLQVVKVSIFGGSPVENPTKKATGLKGVLMAISLSEYGSEGFRLRLRRLSEYGSVAYLVERPTRETQTEQYSDTVLAMLHCDLRVRWKAASDLRFRAAISEPKTSSFCGISGDLAPSTRKSLAIVVLVR